MQQYIEYTQLGANIVAIIALGFVIYQLNLARRAVDAQVQALGAQVTANELNAYLTFNMRFLDIVEQFEKHIQNRKTRESDLSPKEQRAIDRYFYLANAEWILYSNKLINPNLAEQWVKGIQSAANRQAFIDRWRSTASHFTLDDGFREFFEASIKEPDK